MPLWSRRLLAGLVGSADDFAIRALSKDISLVLFRYLISASINMRIRSSDANNMKSVNRSTPSPGTRYRIFLSLSVSSLYICTTPKHVKTVCLYRRLTVYLFVHLSIAPENPFTQSLTPAPCGLHQPGLGSRGRGKSRSSVRRGRQLSSQMTLW
jgi:hypothetical protein